MIKPGGGCDPTELMESMMKATTEFKKTPIVEKTIGLEADNMARIVFEKVFNRKFDGEFHTANYTKGRVETYKRELTRISDAALKGRLTHEFGSLFYTPESIRKSNPQLLELQDKLHNVQLEYNGRTNRHNRAFEKILTSMRRQMVQNWFNESNYFTELKGKRRLKKIQKEADKFERSLEKAGYEVNQAYLNNNPERMRAAKKKFDALLRAEDKFYVEGEGKVFQKMIDVIDTGLKTLDKDAAKKWFGTESRPGLKDKLKRQLKEGKIRIGDYNKKKAEILNPSLSKLKDKYKLGESEFQAVVDYTDLMHDMYGVLGKGVNQYIKGLKASMEGKYDTKTIDSIAEKIAQKIRPSEEVGYYPHFKRFINTVDYLDNLMPYLQKSSDALGEKLINNKAEVQQAINALDTYVSGRAKKRVQLNDTKGFVPKTEYSRNFFSTVKRYIDEVDRFNMIAHADSYTRESLSQAKNLFRNGKELNGFASSTVEMMQDMNRRVKGGSGLQNETAELAMKSLLALEFNSKIGFNLRSPFKNATQGLLNLVEFGFASPARAKKLLREDKDLSAYVDKMMDEAGFLFIDTGPPELIEGQFKGKKFSQKVKITDKETVEFQKPSMLSNVHDKIGNVSRVGGKLMASVENFNRKTTFKIAFSEMYNQLKYSDTFIKSLEAKGMDSKQIENEIRFRAKNYGIRKTTLLHFDYSDLAKSKWMTTPAGRLLGQFQHYGMKVLEYNINLAKEAKDDILVGELTGDRAQKGYRLGFIYGLAPVIASGLTGLDFGNIVQHDVMDKMNKLTALFTGDDEEIKNAYYGKGVLTGLPFIGAPVISDALALGNLYNFINMENETMEKLLTGYEDYSLRTKDQKTYETIRILNVALGRGAYKTLPMILNGNIGSALQYELGLYKTKESKKLKKKLTEGTATEGPMLPKDLINALALLESHRKGGLARNKTLIDPGQSMTPSERSYFDDEGYFDEEGYY